MIMCSSLEKFTNLKDSCLLAQRANYDASRTRALQGLKLSTRSNLVTEVAENVRLVIRIAILQGTISR